VSAPLDRWLWVVRYRRRGWDKEQVRIFRRRYAADRLVRKVRGDSWRWEDLAPLQYVRLERHPLGPVELIEEWR
jgi:hypothetical protein